MRILHITECSLSGGIGSYFEEIAPYQSARFGADRVRFVVPEGHSRFLPSVPRAQIVEFPGQGRTPIGLMRFVRAALAAVRQFQPAIVHLHGACAGAFLRPALMMRRLRPKIVYCPHGWSFVTGVSPLRKNIYRLIERSLAPCADAIVNISNAGRLDALNIGIPDAAMITITNGILDRPVDLAGPKANGDPNVIRLLFLGRHDRQKGLDFLLQGFTAAGLPHLRLDIIGAPVVDEAFHGKPAELASSIVFHGWLSREEAMKLVAKADAVVVPSRWEPFGLVAIEAFRAGKPVIASRRGGLPEIVGHAVTGFLFEMENVAEFTAILGGLDKAALAQMGRKARRKFETDFTSDRMNRELEALYHSLLDRGGARANAA